MRKNTKNGRKIVSKGFSPQELGLNPGGIFLRFLPLDWGSPCFFKNHRFRQIIFAQEYIDIRKERKLVKTY